MAVGGLVVTMTRPRTAAAQFDTLSQPLAANTLLPRHLAAYHIHHGLSHLFQ